MKHLFISFLFGFTLVHAYAQDLGKTILEHNDMATTFASALYNNPANQSTKWNTSLSEVSISYDGKQSSAAINLEDGKSQNLLIVDANAYLIKGKSTIWGKADYSNGLIKQQLYNETCDTWLLYPYIMADTVGGNTSVERYHFMGGFAHNLGKWKIAAEGEYTALLAYRNIDPRPKNLTGDLRITLGASTKLSRYELGLAINGRRYKQTNELLFYNEVSTPIVYHLTGLGNDYYRFRGMNTDTYYDGWGAGGVLSLRGPISATAEINHIHIKKVISSLNQLPMAFTGTTTQSLQIAFLKESWGIKIDQSYFNRRGTENIFGSAQSNIYPLISSAQQYRHEEASVVATAMWQRKTASSLIGIQLSSGWHSRKESFQLPSSKMNSDSWNSRLSFCATTVCNKFTLGLNMAFGITNPIGKSELLLSNSTAGSGATTAFTNPIVARYNYLSSNHYDTTLAIEATYSLSKSCALLARAKWQYDRFAKTEHRNSEVVSLGLRF